MWPHVPFRVQKQFIYKLLIIAHLRNRVLYIFSITPRALYFDVWLEASICLLMRGAARHVVTPQDFPKGGLGPIESIPTATRIAAAPAPSPPAVMSAESAFQKEMQAARKKMEALAAIEGELKADEQKLQAALSSLQQKLEDHVRALSVANTKHARLVKELAACEEEIKQNETGKREVTAKIHEATQKAIAVREEKLRKITGAPAPAPAARAPPGGSADMICGDLLGMASSAPAAAAARAAPPPDLFGADLMGATPPPPPPPRPVAGSSPMADLMGLGAALPVAPSHAMGGTGIMGGMIGGMTGGMGVMGLGGMGMSGMGSMMGGGGMMGNGRGITVGSSMGSGGTPAPKGGAKGSDDSFEGFDGF